MIHGTTPEAPKTPTESVPAAVEAPVTVGGDQQPIVPARAGGLSDSKKYTGRFAIVYIGLGLVLAGAAVGFVTLVIQPAAVVGESWSSWKPGGGNADKVSKEISDHVAAKYRLSAAGGQLVAVIPSKPTITNNATKIPLEAMAIRKAPQTDTGIRILATDKMRLITLCGLGANCSIAEGEPTETRGRLTRREALEIALYTFKYVPAVDSIVAYMPPPPGETMSPVLFLEKSALTEQLSQPLNETLVLAKPPLPNEENKLEAATIDRLTLKSVFTYELVALQTGGAALVLDPAA